MTSSSSQEDSSSDSSSSEEDSSSDDGETAKLLAEVDNTPQKGTADGQDLENVDEEMEELPDAPLDSWPSVKVLCMGDVVMYKILELSAKWKPQVKQFSLC